MRLRLHPDGATYFDKWCRLCSTTGDDIHLVADLLEAYAAQDGWQERFSHHQDVADPAVIIVAPRAGLYVHILKWTGEDEDEFSLVGIQVCKRAGAAEA